jgi:hypothetical protein
VLIPDFNNADFNNADFDNADFDNEREDRFEAYLKQFRPLPAEPLQNETPRRAIRHSLTLAAWAAAVASVILIASLLVLPTRIGHTPSSVGQRDLESRERLADSDPLTIGSANALLTNAPSIEQALDRVPFHSPSLQLPKGKHSALAVLSEYKVKDKL